MIVPVIILRYLELLVSTCSSVYSAGLVVDLVLLPSNKFKFQSFMLQAVPPSLKFGMLHCN